MKNVTCFSDLLDAYRQMPGFYKEYLTEGEQRKEAVKRLGILGVSEKEIELFKEEGIIPIIEDSSDGIRRGEECQSSFSINWREHTGVPGFFRELEGRLPYLIFDSRGAIPMAAVLFVEDKREDTEIFQSEFSRNTDELMLSALGTMGEGASPTAFFFSHDTEYGEIVVRLTEDGPIRVE